MLYEKISIRRERSNQCPYCHRVHAGPQAGNDDAMFAEMMAVVGMATRPSGCRAAKGDRRAVNIGRSGAALPACTFTLV